MNIRPLIGALGALALSVAALAQNTGSSITDQLDSLRQNLTPEQQQSITQGLLGGQSGGGTRSTPPLNMPNTVQPRLVNQPEQIKERKTADGHVLRNPNENPELQADDWVLIELTPIEVYCRANLPRPTPRTGNTNAPALPNLNESVDVSSDSDNSAEEWPLNQNGGYADANVTGLGAAGVARGNLNPLQQGVEDQEMRETREEAYRKCPLLGSKKKTEDERARLDKFRKRILANNPYRLNRFGVLEIPGLPSVPLAGLTAREATERLNADPDLGDFNVKLVILRLQPLGEEALKPFGYDLFQGVPSTFAPVSDIAVPLDYVVGPGDRLDIQLYGNEPASYKLTVERDGRILFPKIGPIVVGAMTFEQVRSEIERRVSQQLIGAHVSISMGDLRSIRVFVLGEAEKPGSYTVSGLSTMTNALFVSGGVKRIGSLRTIILKREGRIVSVLDLYDLLLHGDTSGDRKLLPGDVIFIPPIGHTVAVGGSVRRPAIYETKGEKTIAEAMQLAGGVLPDADPQRVQVERIAPSHVREVINVDLANPTSAQLPLTDGDKILIAQIRPQLENSVTLGGYVYRPGKFEWHSGMRLTDVIGDVKELRPDADLHYIMIRRLVPPDERVQVLSADLHRALRSPGSAANPVLNPRDEITVFDLSASRDRIIEPVLRTLELQASPDHPEEIVRVDGRVKAPGRYPLEPTMHISDLIRAGGSLEDSAFRGDAELTRYEVIDGQVRKTAFMPVDLGAIHRGEKEADITLRPYDVLVIKPIAQWTEPGNIEVLGEVRFPGKYPIHQGETLSSVLHRAGGLTDIAFAYGAVYLRQDLKKREKDEIDLLANRLQGDLAALSLEAVATGSVSGGGGGAAGAAEALTVGSQLLQQLRNTKPVGRLVIDIQRVMQTRPGSPDDVLVKDGDKLVIPKKTQEITILGEVQSPTSHVFEPGLTRNDYIAKSGGVTQHADRKRIYVVRANGDVVSGSRSGWFRRSQTVEMRAGDTIVVPLDTQRVRGLPLWQAITQIFYNLAIPIVLIKQYL
jgi:protein involved in polysaccharide export with SLBB domain